MRRWLVRLLTISFVLSSTGCAQLSYYAQATQGQLGLVASAKPIDQWLADPNVSDQLKQRLTRTQQIRKFAVQELDLPDNGSYTRYAELNRPYVVWNVIATPELSMKPVQWCFPIAGCVDYRGYYRKEDAQRFAQELRGQGYEVRVSGVPAYSTLGWFNDPVLSTFIAYPEAEVARMLFHELAHQVAYAPGDTPFNESFATTVESIGVEQWLDKHGNPDSRERYRQFRQRKRDFIDLLTQHRQRLEEVFATDISDDEKRNQKALVITSLKQAYHQIRDEKWGGYSGYDQWFNEPITNAHFVLVATYEELVPAFQALHAKSGSMKKFYANVQAMAKQDKARRRERLALLLGMPSSAQTLSPVDEDPDPSAPTAAAQ
ncbi:MAG: aminopeptidase [Oxalobacteraceae bacterium]|jgi:predicted aminopeptidase|nr:aminopeptidase [Oxalobacteraceae bacterium]